MRNFLENFTLITGGIASLFHKFNIFSSSSSKMVSFSLLNFFIFSSTILKFPPLLLMILLFLFFLYQTGQKRPKAGRKGQTQITSVRKIIGGVKTIGGGGRGGERGGWGILTLWRREKIEEGKILRLWARE